MKYPKKLKKGNTIGIVCPSSAISEERTKACKTVLEEMGFKVKLADNLSTNYAGYMAGDGKVRGEWINKMFADKEVDAIICARGGDGGSRAMEYLDYDLIASNPKVFVGYSDVTSMHFAITQKCNFVTFHGPMVSSNFVNGLDSESLDGFFKAVSSDEDFEFKNPEGFPIKTLKSGTAEGDIIGGNLAVMTASIGTEYELDTKGKILFIEEIGESMSRVDRMIYQLKNSGKFKDAVGILLGQFTKCINEDQTDYNELSILKDALEEIDIPVLYNLQSGHGDKIITIPMGSYCKIDGLKKTVSFKVKR